MTELIITILLYIGAVNSPQEVNSNIISQNQEQIEIVKNSPAFKEYMQEKCQDGGIGIMDPMEW